MSTTTPGMLIASTSQQGAGWRCLRALTTAAAIDVDILTCADEPTGALAAQRIAREIADRVAANDRLATIDHRAPERIAAMTATPFTDIPPEQRLSARKQPRQSSARKRRKSERPRRGPPKPPRPSSTTLRRNAARLQASARRPTGSRSWPTSKSRSGVPIASTTADGWGCAAVWVPTSFASGTDVALAESRRSPNTHYGSGGQYQHVEATSECRSRCGYQRGHDIGVPDRSSPQRGHYSPSRCCSR